MTPYRRRYLRCVNAPLAPIETRAAVHTFRLPSFSNIDAESELKLASCFGDVAVVLCKRDVATLQEDTGQRHSKSACEMDGSVRQAYRNHRCVR